MRYSLNDGLRRSATFCWSPTTTALCALDFADHEPGCTVYCATTTGSSTWSLAPRLPRSPMRLTPISPATSTPWPT